MSNKRYRRLPGTPATSEDQKAREEALARLAGPLGEIMDEISVASETAEAYRDELRERRVKRARGQDPGRWNIAPGIGLRALAMLRRLREKRDALIAEGEQQALERMQAEAPEPEATPVAQEAAAPAEQPVTTPAAQPRQPEAAPTPAKAREPAAAA
ncbi:MAG: hypothetical protein H6841_08540 [Planctomycetes bacterium]|nr:hypothetical protein [Planctomycetota bacterium]MCB9934807.1 hypothetical protein [Planctomycetota bacterium]